MIQNVDKEIIEEVEDLQEVEKTLRPQNLNSFIGQGSLKEKLRIAIGAAKERDEPVPSCLIHGPSGLGKSTIAQIIANEYGTKCETIMCPAVKSQADLISNLIKLEKNEILFCDEIHALTTKVSEVLYSAMEDFAITRRIDSKQVMHIKINPFCLIGATTNIGYLSEPLRNRFGITHCLVPYTNTELFGIVAANLQKIGLIPKNDDVVMQIAQRCRGVPRLSVRLIHRLRDYCQIENKDTLDQEAIDYVMELEGLDNNGLTKLDRDYMTVLYENFALIPAGINSICGVLNQDKEYIERDIEPTLMSKGLIIKTKSGRSLTTQGIEYINI